MCGIVAAISKSTAGFRYKEDNVFLQMLYANALRGFDSTGMYGINKYGNLDMVKSALPAGPFLTTKTVEDFAANIYQKYRIVVGHNRAATKGKIVDTNAHPFIEKDICLVHNGTLYNHKHLADVEVDSHAITHALAEKDYKEVIPELDGAYALIWYDANTKKLHISRNKERPLWVMTSKDLDIIASEPRMLEWIAERNGLKGMDGPAYFKENHVYTYDIDDLADGFSLEELPAKKPWKGLHHMMTGPSNISYLPRGGKTHTKDNKDFWKDYKYGQNVYVTISSEEYKDGNVIYRGMTSAHKDPWVCTMPYNKRITNFNAKTTLVGVVSGTTTKNDYTRLILRDLSLGKTYLSCNDITITDEEFTEHGGCCDNCGSFIDPSTEFFWVRYKPGKIKAMRCEECVLEDENISHYITEALKK